MSMQGGGAQGIDILARRYIRQPWVGEIRIIRAGRKVSSDHMVVHSPVSAVAVFAIFLLINSGMALYCWSVFRRHWRRLRDPNLYRPEKERSWFTLLLMASPLVKQYLPMTERERSRFTLMVMWLPCLGFTGASLVWLYMTLEEIITMIARSMH